MTSEHLKSHYFHYREGFFVIIFLWKWHQGSGSFTLLGSREIVVIISSAYLSLLSKGQRKVKEMYSFIPANFGLSHEIKATHEAEQAV